MALSVYFKDTISKPASDIYRAIIEERHQANYLISSADADLAPGQTIQWTFADAGVTVPVLVKKLETDQLIRFEWLATDTPTLVEIRLISNGG